MKIALYIAGHIKMWNEYTKNKLKDFIQGYDVDIFISTYYSTNRTEINWNNIPGWNSFDNININSDNIKEMFSEFPVKGIMITSDQIEKEDCVPEDNVYIWRVWTKIHQCNEMRKEYEIQNNIKYDFVIRTRPDIVILEKVFFENLPSLDNNLIVGFGGTLGYPDDMFAIGSVKVMNHYCDIKKTIYEPSGTHTIVAQTAKVYPILGYIQIGIIRPGINLEPNKNIIKFYNDKEVFYLNWYDKSLF